MKILSTAMLHASILLAILGAGCGGTGEPGADVLPSDTPPDESMVARVPYRVLCFNVMCSACGSPADEPWDARVAHFGDLFARLQPDLVGLQELIVGDEVDQVLAVAPGFAASYFPGNDDFIPYPDAAVLYRTDRFQEIETGWYWLSPTPDTAGSLGFSPGQILPRVVAWVHLKDRVHATDLYFATTHFDSTHPQQENSAPLVIERTAPWAARMPVIQTGDFNTEPRDPAFQVLTRGVDATGFRFEDAFALAPGWHVESDAEPPPPYDPTNRIDHVLVAGGDWTATDWFVDLHRYGPDRRFPSDHRAVMAVLELALPPR